MDKRTQYYDDVIQQMLMTGFGPQIIFFSAWFFLSTSSFSLSLIQFYDLRPGRRLSCDAMINFNAPIKKFTFFRLKKIENDEIIGRNDANHRKKSPRKIIKTKTILWRKKTLQKHSGGVNSFTSRSNFGFDFFLIFVKNAWKKLLSFLYVQLRNIFEHFQWAW